MTDKYHPTPTDALIVIDMQNDFCPGGALEVPEGDVIVPLINDLMDKFETVVFTQDWHPKGHHSFASAHEGREALETIQADYGEQVLWPDHCVQGTEGAAFHKDLRREPAQLVIRKGFRKEIDSYSAFFENDKKTSTGLTGYLQERGVKRLFFVGLALDFCVGWSAEDAVKQGFGSVVLEDASRGIDADGSLDAMLRTFQEVGVARAKAADVA